MEHWSGFSPDVCIKIEGLILLFYCKDCKIVLAAQTDARCTSELTIKSSLGGEQAAGEFPCAQIELSVIGGEQQQIQIQIQDQMTVT